MNTDRTNLTAEFILEITDGWLNEADIIDINHLHGHGPNTAYHVKIENDADVVVKHADNDGNSELLHREAVVLKHLHDSNTIPTPRIHGYNWDDAPSQTLIMDLITGRPMKEIIQSTPAHVQPQLFAEIGENLAQIHAHTRFDHPGKIVDCNGQEIRVDTRQTWGELLAARLSDRVISLADTEFEQLAEEAWEVISEDLHQLKTETQFSLLHGDIGDDNILHNEEKISGILDWERSFIGHPEYDLCRAEVRLFFSNWGEKTLSQQMLYKGYQSIQELDAGFSQRRRYYLMMFYLHSLQYLSRTSSSNVESQLTDRVAECIRTFIDQID